MLAGTSRDGAVRREYETVLSLRARLLRKLHASIGVFELGCLAYLWICAITRRRDGLLTLALGVLAGEGALLAATGGCPLGICQRRAGDDVAMFELWFGPRLAPFAIPGFTLAALGGAVALATRHPAPAAAPGRANSGHDQVPRQQRWCGDPRLAATYLRDAARVPVT